MEQWILWSVKPRYLVQEERFETQTVNHTFLDGSL